MSNLPPELKYTISHEWLRLDDNGTATIGITDHAQGLLGDIVYVELPEIGDYIAVGGDAGVIESVKAASDIYSPVSGEVVDVNEQLNDHPEQINTSAYDQGWLFKIKLADPAEQDNLLTAAAYQEEIAKDN
jgi:glycine cleavage system H protein